MSRRAKVSIVVLFGWTAFVWLTRISNAWNDAAMTSAGKVLTTSVSLALVALAAASVVAVFAGRAVRVVQVFLGATVLVWLIRVPQILLDDHDVAFKVVHATLGVISVALAAVVWRAVRSEPPWANPSPSSRSRAPHQVSSGTRSTAP
jgi:hypothetical protein